jgi:citrate synthase
MSELHPVTVAKATSNGLEGVVAAETRLSDVDGERGHLILAGHDVETLAPRASYEAACGLFWRGRLPDAWAEADLQKQLGAARVKAFGRLDKLGDALSAADGMDALRAAAAHVEPDGDPVAESAALAGALAVYAAAWSRLQQGLAPVPPDPRLGQAADLLRMVRGAAGSVAEVKALETYLVTVTDHGMNASTFAARVVASTGSDRVSAVVAALGALKGPLHGGAPGPVLDMLDAIGAPDQAEAWLEGELASGRRIMGMGHRVYRVRDPRAAVLEQAVERLEQAGAAAAGARLPLARAVEKAATGVLKARHPNRPLAANVEFYTAVLLDAVGLPRTLFTPAFAIGRVLGWCAHVDEQRQTGRLIRPASRYVGPQPASTGPTNSPAAP